MKYMEIYEALKTAYVGKYNWHGEVHTLYASAHSKLQAHMLFCNQLADKLKRSAVSVKNYFNKPNSYDIKER